MVDVYQLIFFLALGLLAIAITVFVLAVSLLGRAIKMAINEEEKTNRELKESDAEEMEKIQRELIRAKEESGNPDIKRLEKSLNRLKRRKRISAWKLKWISAKPKLLGSVWGALIPGMFFLASAITCIVAIYKGGGIPQVYPYMWIAMAMMGVGICFVCLSLKVIGGVARISEEVAFQRDVNIFKTSLKDFEEEKRPELILSFHKESPPFHVKVDSEITIGFKVNLVKGEYADNVSVYFLAPKGFDFPGKTTYFQEEDHEIVPGYLTTIVEFEKPILHAILTPSNIVIKAPSKADKYQLYYRIIGKNSEGRYEKFGTVVEEKEVVRE